MSVAVDVVDKLQRAYDEFPYHSHAFMQSAPERLAAIAHIFGIDTPPMATARVLELGCSSGGNLIPFAARNPGATAVGLDLSPVQVDQGKTRARALDLDNVDIRQMDLSVADASLGSFDFIICHGVYSWVPEHVQQAVLRVCRECLSPKGVAYISYNTYPGWKSREIIRDAMMLRGFDRQLPAERLAYARGMIDFLSQVATRDSLLAKTLEEAVPMLRDAQEHYLVHEYLEPCNAPCYFKEFVARAEANGLAYLGDAEPNSMFASNYGRAVAEPLIKEFGHSQVLLEQYLDFVVNRPFRQTLLVHADRAGDIRYRLDPSRLRSLHFAAELPCRVGESTADATAQRFGTDDNSAIVLSHPGLKAAAALLTRSWPATVALPELREAALVATPASAPAQTPRGDKAAQAKAAEVKGVSVKAADGKECAVKAGDAPTTDNGPQAAGIEDLLDLLLEHLVVRARGFYRLSALPLIAEADPRPDVGALIRKAAELSKQDTYPEIFNPWHEQVPLGAVGTALLPHMDGTRDRKDLMKLLREEVTAGRVAFRRADQVVSDPDGIERCIVEQVDQLIAGLPRSKLLGCP